MAKSIYNSRLRKKRFIEAFTTRLGNITLACKDIKLDRQTFYDWKATDEEFKKAVEEVNQVVLDFAEGKLMGLINKQNPAAIIFFLKCRAKERGYIERQEITIDDYSKDALKEQLLKVNVDVLAGIDANLETALDAK